MMLTHRTIILALGVASARGFVLRSRSSVVVPASNFASPTFRLFTATANAQDTPTQLPEFADKASYLEYMESVATLPQGFATGTADATFVSVEAPGLGPLPIRGTVIHLTNGPTDSWAAVYTKNKVSCQQRGHKDDWYFNAP